MNPHLSRSHSGVLPASLRLTLAALLLTSVIPAAAPAGVIQLPQTGQKSCYDPAGAVIACAGTGQDGDLLMGVPAPDPRFTDNNDGTVTDNLTGLIWLKNARCFDEEHWPDALNHVKTLQHGECGLSDHSAAGDWHLPNILELDSLVDISRADPALPADHPFSNVQLTGYWSSTTNAFHDIRARYVYMPNGAINGSEKATATHFVWPVR